MTTATPLARYSAVEGAIATGAFADDLHHVLGHIRHFVGLATSFVYQSLSLASGEIAERCHTILLWLD
ncbi:hypothetical protein [Mesorhizobium sp. M1329]|uniref:hypothetical protein n=1 Tax=Mesorhizobium sp. M1329 TaxID=2957083 RepID=UPI00333D0AC5